MRRMLAAAVTLVGFFLLGQVTVGSGQNCERDPYYNVRGKDGPYEVDLASLKPYRMKEWNMAQPWPEVIKVPSIHLPLRVGGKEAFGDIQLSWGNRWSNRPQDKEQASLCVYVPSFDYTPVCIQAAAFSINRAFADSGWASIYYLQRGHNQELDGFVDSVFNCEKTKLDSYILVDAYCIKTPLHAANQNWRLIIGTTKNSDGKQPETWVGIVLSDPAKNWGGHSIMGKMKTVPPKYARNKYFLLMGRDTKTIQLNAESGYLIHIMSLENFMKNYKNWRKDLKYRSTRYSSICKFKPKNLQLLPDEVADYDYYDYADEIEIGQTCRVHGNPYSAVKGRPLDMRKMDKKPYKVKRWDMSKMSDSVVAVEGDTLPINITGVHSESNIYFSWGNRWSEDDSQEGELCFYMRELDSSPICVHPMNYKLGANNTGVATMYHLSRHTWPWLQYWVDDAFFCAQRKLTEFIIVDAKCVKTTDTPEQQRIVHGATKEAIQAEKIKTEQRTVHWRLILGTTGGKQPETWLALLISDSEVVEQYITSGDGTKYSWNPDGINGRFINMMNLDKGVVNNGKTMQFVNSMPGSHCLSAGRKRPWRGKRAARSRGRSILDKMLGRRKHIRQDKKHRRKLWERADYKSNKARMNDKEQRQIKRKKWTIRDRYRDKLRAARRGKAD